MGRKNHNAREAVYSPETMARMIRRVQKEDKVFEAHQRKDEFSMSYSEWLSLRERRAKRLSK